MAKPGKSARTKGHSFERKIAQEFRELGWPRTCRQLEYQKNHALGCDLENTEPFNVQCKAHKDYAPISSILEVKDAKGRYPLLLTKGDHKRPVAVMYWDNFKEILKMLKEKEFKNNL